MSRTVIDQMGEKVTLALHPQRIISLVPSQTELLFDLGLDAEIAAVTRFCLHPGDKTSVKVRIGGTKDFNIELIKSLKPDLIIGNKEENYEKGINELKKDFPVWMSDIYSLADAIQMMSSVGEITNRSEQAVTLVREIQSTFSELSIVNYQLSIKTCAYFIWRKPYMVAATGTFIDNMLGVYGVRNVFSDLARYPVVTASQIAAAAPDLIFLSSEPYSFTDRHKGEFQELCPKSKVIIVNGELFSWYGSRLKYTAQYFEDLRLSITDEI